MDTREYDSSETQNCSVALFYLAETGEGTCFTYIWCFSPAVELSGFLSIEVLRPTSHCKQQKPPIRPKRHFPLVVKRLKSDQEVTFRAPNVSFESL